jgi:hypothetical protein
VLLKFLFAFAAVGGYAAATADTIVVASDVDVVYGNGAVVISTVASAFDILFIKKNVQYVPYVLNELSLNNSRMISKYSGFFSNPRKPKP